MTANNFTLPLYTSKECGPDLIAQKTVAIIGFGSQGQAQAQNLRDSGVRVLIGLRDMSARAALAKEMGFDVLAPAQAVLQSDLVMLLTPDETHQALYETEISPNLKSGGALGFSHGLAIHFNLIQPRADIDVILIAPKAIGPAVRSEYLAGRGPAGLIAVHQDVSGHAKELALSYAAALGCARTGIFETSFKIECEADLFGEQAVLCGPLPALITAAYDTLVDAGYPPEIAYFECVHEVKLVVDIIYARGIAGMRDKISNTAAYGAFRAQDRIVTDSTRAEMKKLLAEIQDQSFIADFLGPQQGLKKLPEYKAAAAQHPVENIGAALRKLMNISGQ
jgi:ketol-acid reductoisomerase